MPESRHDVVGDESQGATIINNLAPMVESMLVLNHAESVSAMTSSGLDDGTITQSNSSYINGDVSRVLSSSTLASPMFKDQTRKVVETVCDSAAVVTHSDSNLVDESHAANSVNTVGSSIDAGFGSNADHAIPASVHAQTTIPMADAVLIEDKNESPISSIDPHVVHLEDEACASFRPQASASTTTNDTEATTTSSHDNNISNRALNSEFPDVGGSGSREAIEQEMRKMATDAVVGERKFWLRIVIIAVGLNTLLVAGVVVAAFCLNGRCISPDSNVPSPSSTSIESSSISPTANGTIQNVSNVDNENENERFKQTQAPLDENLPLQTQNPLATLPPATVGMVITTTTVPPSTTAPFNSSLAADGGDFGDFTSQSPQATVVPSAPAPTDNGSEESNFSLTKLSILISVAVIVETLIMVTLFSYYRKWKRNRVMKHDSEIDTSTP